MQKYIQSTYCVFTGVYIGSLLGAYKVHAEVHTGHLVFLQEYLIGNGYSPGAYEILAGYVQGIQRTYMVLMGVHGEAHTGDLQCFYRSM